ncbi:MAG TPA: adenylate/guanylate cyclase domain-containing protein [Rhizomicrobium sp.]|nr:adenylate/guanylate cyclase domain-containing protein [Rhizomicrobium sp.]
MTERVPPDDSPALRVAAIGHREISPLLKARVAAAAKQVLTDIRDGAQGASRLVLVSPLAQGADQLIATTALELGYRLEAVLPAPPTDYERTFGLDTEEQDIALFRDLMAKAAPPQGEGVLALAGDLSSSDARDHAFLACADAVIRRADMVVVILSKDRWQSQSGQTVRDALALDIPVIVIAPEAPEQPDLHEREARNQASPDAIRMMASATMARKLPDVIAKAKNLLAAGGCLAVIDLLRNLSDGAAAGRLVERDYLLVLALARMGAARLALETFKSRLARQPLDNLPVALARDVLALEARCLKDLSLETASPEGLLEAARAYEGVYQRFGGYYPLINAATLMLLGGDRERAQRLAAQVLVEAGDADYWSLASRAEALLILGDAAQAASVLERASAAPVPPTDLASTKKQLLLVCQANGISSALLSGLRIPTILYYRGEMLPDTETGPLQQDIQSQTRRLNAGFAYGSLANTGDILLAESLLDMGIELNLVLPYRADEFARAAIPAPWAGRFDACVRKATSVSFLLDNDVLHHDCVLAMSAAQAAGLARYRADKVASIALCLAIRDGGLETPELDWPGLCQEPCAGIGPRCLLFADVKGFSKLPERDMEAFVQHFMGGLAAAIQDFAHDIDYRATAGDGVFLVFRTPLLAAQCGLAMQARVGAFDRDRQGIEAALQLRIAIHYGPVHPVHDPILDRPSFAGREIIRAARMEPITPPGEIFVTEQLASALFLAGETGFRCDYVGILPSAKGFGSFRMYSIKSRAEPRNRSAAPSAMLA